MGINVTTAPTETPISVEDVKTHSVIFISDDDAYIETLIGAATAYAENYLGRSLCTQTLTLTLDAFPSVIDLPRTPVQSVTSISYLDANGDSQAFTDYQSDLSGTLSHQIKPAPGFNWPDTREVFGAATVVYVAGYGAASDVPQDIKAALLLMVGSLYENRENELTGVSWSPVSFTTECLLKPYRLTQV